MFHYDLATPKIWNIRHPVLHVLFHVPSSVSPPEAWYVPLVHASLVPAVDVVSFRLPVLGETLPPLLVQAGVATLLAALLLASVVPLVFAFPSLVPSSVSPFQLRERASLLRVLYVASLLAPAEVSPFLPSVSANPPRASVSVLRLFFASLLQVLPLLQSQLRICSGAQARPEFAR